MPCLLSGWKPATNNVCLVDHTDPTLSHASIAPNAVGASLPVKTPAVQPSHGEPGHIKRPRNSFIIFRCEYVAQNRGKASKSTDRSKRLSRMAAETWKSLSTSERDQYMSRAAQEKDEHARLHPNYVYRPNKKRGGHRSSSSKRVTCQAEGVVLDHSRRVEVVAEADSMPFADPMSMVESGFDFVSDASTSYSPPPSMSSSSSDRSTPFAWEIPSPVSEPDYPVTPQREFMAYVSDVVSENEYGSFGYAYQTGDSYLPFAHPMQPSDVYAPSMSTSPSSSYAYDEPASFATSSYSTLANWANESTCSSTSLGFSTTLSGPVPTSPLSSSYAGSSAYSTTPFAPEPISFDTYIYSEPVSTPSQVPVSFESHIPHPFYAC